MHARKASKPTEDEESPSGNVLIHQIYANKGGRIVYRGRKHLVNEDEEECGRTDLDKQKVKRLPFVRFGQF